MMPINKEEDVAEQPRSAMEVVGHLASLTYVSQIGPCLHQDEIIISWQIPLQIWEGSV